MEPEVLTERLTSTAPVGYLPEVPRTSSGPPAGSVRRGRPLGSRRVVAGARTAAAAAARRAGLEAVKKFRNGLGLLPVGSRLHRGSLL
jgi:hypothetical protein